MAQLIPAPFRELVARLYREPAAQGTLFELPRSQWYWPAESDPDLSVDFQGLRAGNPAGLAAGPHTQMAQNILLSYLAGGRIMELRTVQADACEAIPRPSIDAATVGFNIERSQELSIEDAQREYLAGAMLVEIFRHAENPAGGNHAGVSGAAVYELNVGHDLKSVRNERMCRFLAAMRNAGEVVDRLRAEIPREFDAGRRVRFPARLAGSVTLTTSLGCNADEIERICEFLIAEHDYDVFIRVKPTALGRERIEHLLHRVLGYADLRLHPPACAAGPTLDELVQLCRRLVPFAGQRGRRVGFKFCEPLDVSNLRKCLATDGEFVRLSGQPLYVLAMVLADEFRRHAGPHVPVSFCGGVDQANFTSAVACGFAPVGVCTDLLRPAGYARMPAYLRNLVRQMQELEAVNVGEFILRRFGQEGQARRRAVEEGGADADPQELYAAMVRWAGLLNTSILAKAVLEEPRYRAYENRRIPQRIDSRLKLFDCVSCYKCVTVCPNAANFAYPTPIVSFEYHDVLVSPDGRYRQGPRRRYVIARDTQIACYADFCNECGNCETFCPEYGGPYATKAKFHGSERSWEAAAPRDGFVLKEKPEGGWILGRIDGQVYRLTYVRQLQQYLYEDGMVEMCLPAWGHYVVGLRLLKTPTGEHRVDIGVYHSLRYLREGVLDPRRVNQVNVVGMDRPLHASGGPRRD